MENSPESGISTIEALVALAIISIVGMAILGGASTSFKAIGRVRDAAIDTAAVFAIDDWLRSDMEKVRIPYWAQSSQITINDTMIEFPWYEGMQEHTFRLYVSDGSLYAEIADPHNVSRRKIANVTSFKGELITDEGMLPTALRISYGIRDKDYVSVLPFGSSPLRKNP